MAETEILQELVQRALQQYPISEYTAEFIRHNENITYHIHDTIADKRYLLRIHSPRFEGFQGLQQEKRAIESECQWLIALAQNTDIAIQQPVCNETHEFVSMIPDLSGRNLIPCTMLTWLEGELFAQDIEDAEEWVHKLGSLTAALHAHAQSWTPPRNFLRLVYNADMFQHALRALENGIQHGVIQSQDMQHVREAGAFISERLHALDKNPGAWGLIHADLLSGNVLIQNDGTLSPIDFSLSGFGPYLLDVGICVCNLKNPLRKAYLQGYGASLSEQHLHDIEACILMIILISSSRHVTQAEWQQWFQQRFPVIARTYCPKLLRYDTFLFDI